MDGRAGPWEPQPHSAGPAPCPAVGAQEGTGDPAVPSCALGAQEGTGDSPKAVVPGPCVSGASSAAVLVPSFRTLFIMSHACE